MGVAAKNIKKVSINSPTISVIIATYNSQNTIDKCLSSVRIQAYPQDKIEIIIVDGGSSDNTLNIVKKYNAKILHVPKDLQNAEYNKGVGVRNATGELLLMIDHDNVLPHTAWLVNMTMPFLDSNEIVGVETLRYHYSSSLSLLDRYFALFGAGDPLAFYLGKADRLSYLTDRYNLFGEAKDMGKYYLVKFNKEEIPTLGANGFMVRREILVKNAQVDSKHFYHIDVNVDLIKKGINKYAFVKDDIIHLTGYKNISSFLYRRKLFMEQYHINNNSTRRYSVYMPQDKGKLVVFILYAATIIKPTFDAIRGYSRVPDVAWFLHPVLAFSLLSIYTYVVLSSWLRKHIYVKK